MPCLLNIAYTRGFQGSFTSATKRTPRFGQGAWRKQSIALFSA